MKTLFIGRASDLRRVFCLSVLWILILPGMSVLAQWEAFDALIEHELAKGEVPGLSVAVVKEGNVVYMKGAGFANVKKKIPAAAATPYMIGSVTKQFTAMGTLLLVEEGLVDLDEKVRTYLPELTEAYDAVTVRHLLTHTSGIKSDFKKRSEPPFFNESLIGQELYEELNKRRLSLPRVTP